MPYAGIWALCFEIFHFFKKSWKSRLTVQFLYSQCCQLICFYFLIAQLNNTWLVITTNLLEMLRIKPAMQPVVPMLWRHGASAEEGQAAASLLLCLVCPHVGLTHLPACTGFAAILHLLVPALLACLLFFPCCQGWWPSHLLRRDPWHWISLSNLAPCLYCDEWRWADDKQRSLGRRSNAPPGLPRAYLWLLLWEVPPTIMWCLPRVNLSTLSIPLPSSSGKIEICKEDLRKQNPWQPVWNFLFSFVIWWL